LKELQQAEHRKGILLILGAALLWSTGGIGIKSVAAGPLVVSFYRSLIAGVVLFAIFRPRVWRWSPAFIAAIISYAACLTSFVTATKWTTAANAIFLQYAGVVWVLLFSPLVTRERLRLHDVVAVSAAIGGMALFFVGRFSAHGAAGNLMALVSSVFFAVLILALRVERGVAAEAAVTWGNVLAAVAIFPFIRTELAVDLRSASYLLFLGVFQIACAYALFVRGIRTVSATEASLTGMFEPVANPIWVFLLLGERPSVWAIAGGAIVLSAIAWRTLRVEPLPRAVSLRPTDENAECRLQESSSSKFEVRYRTFVEGRRRGGRAATARSRRSRNARSGVEP
jgi:drug/metabolite transporter, DME family